MPARVTRARARCPRCRREVATSRPKDTDGSVDVFRRHAVIKGGRTICDGSRTEVAVGQYVVVTK